MPPDRGPYSTDEYRSFFGPPGKLDTTKALRAQQTRVGLEFEAKLARANVDDLTRKWSADLPITEKGRLNACIADAKEILDECVAKYANCVNPRQPSGKGKATTDEAPPSTGGSGSARGGNATYSDSDDEPLMKRQEPVCSVDNVSDDESDDCVVVEPKAAEALEAQRKEAKEASAPAPKDKEASAPTPKAGPKAEPKAEPKAGPSSGKRKTRVESNAEQPSGKGKERAEPPANAEAHAIQAADAANASFDDAPFDLKAYAALGLDATCPQQDIVPAYKRLVLYWHPDKNKHPDKGVATMICDRMFKAKFILSDPEHRRNYDNKAWNIDDSSHTANPYDLGEGEDGTEAKKAEARFDRAAAAERQREKEAERKRAAANKRKAAAAARR